MPMANCKEAEPTCKLKPLCMHIIWLPGVVGLGIGMRHQHDKLERVQR